MNTPNAFLTGVLTSAVLVILITHGLIIMANAAIKYMEIVGDVPAILSIVTTLIVFGLMDK